MEEKILQTKKNGMTMLLLTLLGYVAAVVVGGIGFVMLYTTFLGFIPLAIAVIYAIIGIFLFAGLKVLKPEEALVLTLFGDYIGTLKGDYFLSADHFFNQCSLPSSGLTLLPEHRIRSGRNEFRHYETKWCQYDHQQCYPHILREHENQCHNDRHDS